MNVSEAVQVFILIYILVMAALFLSSRYWSPIVGKLWRALGFGMSSQAAAVSSSAGVSIPLASAHFRPGAPRPPRLRAAPFVDLDHPDAARTYGYRLVLCARIVGFVALGNPTGFPAGLFMEWFAARWRGDPVDPSILPEDVVAHALQSIPSDPMEQDALVDEFMNGASYAEQSDLVHFCGEAFAAARSGSPVRSCILALMDRMAVALPADSVGSSPLEEQDRLLLERRLEVDFMPEIQMKVAHLRRMHAFFRGRLIALRDDVSAERRTDRMSDCRRHMEEHEKLLSCFGVSA
jgi:hypothetical protein